MFIDKSNNTLIGIYIDMYTYLCMLAELNKNYLYEKPIFIDAGPGAKPV